MALSQPKMHSVWLILMLIGLARYSHACGHHHVYADIHKTSSAHQNFRQHIMKSDGHHLAADVRRNLASVVVQPQPIRIHVQYQRVDLDANMTKMLMLVVDDVVRVLQKYIKVRRPVQGTLLPQPLCVGTTDRQGNGCTGYYPDVRAGVTNSVCGLAVMNTSHIANPNSRTANGTYTSYTGGRGDATDMYMYITATENEDCEAGAAAWAKPCLYDFATNRPVLGAANICPYFFKSDQTPEAFTAILAHEFLHALGFTSSMFKLFIDASGGPLPETSIAVNATSLQGLPTIKIISPNVRAQAAAQFNCSGLDGAVMEDDGGQGSAMSHWEYTYYQGELMVGSTSFSLAGDPPRMSKMTLAFMEDTGWYTANWDAAMFLNWGHQAGCDFVRKSCSAYSASNPTTTPFCNLNTANAANRSTLYTCTNTYKSSGSCQNSTFSQCGILASKGSSQSCFNPRYLYAYPEVFGWTNDAIARCYPVQYKFVGRLNGFQYSFPGQSSVNAQYDAACFNSQCNSQGNLFINLFGTSIPCPAGTNISLAKVMPDRFLSGMIGPCPDNEAVCDTLGCSNCSPIGGECFNSRCYCKLGYIGANCSISLLSGTGAIVPANTSDLAWSIPSGSITVIQLSMTAVQPKAQVAAVQSTLLSTVAAWASLNSSLARMKFLLDVPYALNISNTTVTSAAPASSMKPQEDEGVQRRVAQAVTSTQVTMELAMPSKVVTDAVLAKLSSASSLAALVSSIKSTTSLTVLSSSINAQVLVTQTFNNTPDQGLNIPLNDLGPITRQDENIIKQPIFTIAVAVGAAIVITIILISIITTIIVRRRRRGPKNVPAFDPTMFQNIAASSPSQGPAVASSASTAASTRNHTRVLSASDMSIEMSGSSRNDAGVQNGSGGRPQQTSGGLFGGLFGRGQNSQQVAAPSRFVPPPYLPPDNL